MLKTYTCALPSDDLRRDLRTIAEANPHHPPNVVAALAFRSLEKRLKQRAELAHRMASLAIEVPDLEVRADTYHDVHSIEVSGPAEVLDRFACTEEHDELDRPLRYAVEKLDESVLEWIANSTVDDLTVPFSAEQIHRVTVLVEHRGRLETRGVSHYVQHSTPDPTLAPWFQDGEGLLHLAWIPLHHEWFEEIEPLLAHHAYLAKVDPHGAHSGVGPVHIVWRRVPVGDEAGLAAVFRGVEPVGCQRIEH